MILAAGAATAAAIFVVDLAQPLGNAIGMLYVLVIVLGLWTEWSPYPMVAALTATVLLMVDLAVGWTSTVPSSEFVNRPLMVLVFTSTAVLVTRFKRLERRAFSNVQQLEDLKRALDAAAIVATTDVTGRITYVNDKFCEISQYSRAELLGQDHRIINSALHSKEFIRDLWHTIANGRVWHGEIRNRAKDGHYYWVDTTIVPFLNERGKPYQYIAIRADITARKEAEERLTQQASLARVGQLAAVVAHEVKNPLAGIKGAVQVLMSRRGANDPEQQVMRDIIGAHRCAERADRRSPGVRPAPRPASGPRQSPAAARRGGLDAAAGSAGIHDRGRDRGRRDRGRGRRRVASGDRLEPADQCSAGAGRPGPYHGDLVSTGPVGHRRYSRQRARNTS